MKETNVKKLVLATKKISLLDSKEANRIKGGTGRFCTTFCETCEECDKRVTVHNSCTRKPPTVNGVNILIVFLQDR